MTNILFLLLDGNCIVTDASNLKISVSPAM